MFSAVLFAFVKPAEQNQQVIKQEEDLKLQLNTVDLKIAKTEDKLQQQQPQKVVHKKNGGQMFL
jgi:hypothetical protein